MLNHRQSATRDATPHVAELARQAGVTPTTVRHYARIGLLRPDRDPGNGYRRFSAADAHRIKFTRQAQSLGLRIGDILEVFEIVDRGEDPRHRVVEVVENRLAEIRERIAAFRSVESNIVVALESWQGLIRKSPKKGGFCHLIEQAADMQATLRYRPREAHDI